MTLPGTVPQDTVSNIEDPQTPVQYKRATLWKLRDTLERQRVKLTAPQRRYKTDFHKKVRFRQVIAVEEFVYVDCPTRPLKSTERGDLPSDRGGLSVKTFAEDRRSVSGTIYHEDHSGRRPRRGLKPREHRSGNQDAAGTPRRHCGRTDTGLAGRDTRTVSGIRG